MPMVRRYSLNKFKIQLRKVPIFFHQTQILISLKRNNKKEIERHQNQNHQGMLMDNKVHGKGNAVRLR